ncbi:MAG: transglutaminase family protein [Planctomycetales bacterium]|nr:transglutaminase family protein [Planctomycetales bacterium]
MNYKITHTTRYLYDDTVPFCQNIVYLTPRDTHNQRCGRHRLAVRPQPTVCHRRTDYFGNLSHAFSIDTGHKQLQITATSQVELSALDLPKKEATPAWETVKQQLPQDKTAAGLDIFQFAFRSPYVPSVADLADYGLQSFSPNRPVLDAIVDLNQRIHSDFQYDPHATNVNTPVTEVFDQRRGVCQDLAHLMLGCIRPLGLAARYVSGYLRTNPPKGKPRLIGADASHAWVSVFCGDIGWVDVDPTNNALPSTQHITVAWGRDYGDVCPVAGMFVGGGSHKLSVSVDVEERYSQEG